MFERYELDAYRASRRRHPFWHVCSWCVSTGRVAIMAVIVELALFWPTHWIFHELGWL